ncbi:MAG TPA: response regulator [Terracidiphilus sp.]|nr:response regulator [Terracidiphilus sp.]
MTTILLVEDDAFQASVRMSVLQKRFPDVQRVADAAEALCLIEQRAFSDDLGLVIASNHLPGLGAPEFVAELHARIPRLPVLVLGNAQDATESYEGQNVRFLAKPAPAEELVATARQMLAEEGHKVA